MSSESMFFDFFEESGFWSTTSASSEAASSSSAPASLERRRLFSLDLVSIFVLGFRLGSFCPVEVKDFSATSGFSHKVFVFNEVKHRVLFSLCLLQSYLSELCFLICEDVPACLRYPFTVFNSSKTFDVHPLWNPIVLSGCFAGIKWSLYRLRKPIVCLNSSLRRIFAQGLFVLLENVPQQRASGVVSYELIFVHLFLNMFRNWIFRLWLQVILWSVTPAVSSSALIVTTITPTSSLSSTIPVRRLWLLDPLRCHIISIHEWLLKLLVPVSCPLRMRSITVAELIFNEVNTGVIIK